MHGNECVQCEHRTMSNVGVNYRFSRGMQQIYHRMCENVQLVLALALAGATEEVVKRGEGASASRIKRKNSGALAGRTGSRRLAVCPARVRG